MKEGRRAIVRVGHAVTFVPLGADYLPPFDKVTSVSVVPFTGDGQIVAAILIVTAACEVLFGTVPNY